LLIGEIAAHVKRFRVCIVTRSHLARTATSPIRRKRVTALVFAVIVFGTILSLCGNGASSQPPKTIRIIVPSTAGGGADFLARMLADQISRAQKVAMVIENRPGASNTIGTESASRATPDGGTLLIATPEFVINPHLRKLNYDPLTSFAPVCYLARSPQLIAVNGASPYRTLDDLFKAARSRPDELTLASAGPGSSTHLAFEMLKHTAGVKMTYVPYHGSTSAVDALLGGYVTAVLASYPNLIAHIETGQLRALATTSSITIKQLPNVPTIAESGLRNYGSDIWFGVVAPTSTPAAIVSQLANWFIAALESPEVHSKLEAQGLSSVGICGAAFGAFIRQQYDESGRAIRESDITLE
jgi:tripartite-type tricarboxylate transporter receptor subunit TctC